VSEDAAASHDAARTPQNNTGSAVFAAICLMTFAGLFLEAGNYGPEAQLFPRLIALLAMGSAAITFVQSFQAARAGVRSAAESRVNWRDIQISYGGPPLYAVLIFVFGFWIASAVSLAGVLFILGVRRPVVVAAITAATLASIYVIFELGFDLRMPGSILLEMYGY
jgi:hypothetical protein